MNIRDYINLVEAFMTPQTGHAFGRKGTEIPKMEPSPKQEEEIKRCRQFPTAEKYAEANNSYGRTYNSDPPHVRRWAQDEAETLMARWNHWKQAGFL